MSRKAQYIKPILQILKGATFAWWSVVVWDVQKRLIYAHFLRYNFRVYFAEYTVPSRIILSGLFISTFFSDEINEAFAITSFTSSSSSELLYDENDDLSRSSSMYGTRFLRLLS